MKNTFIEQTARDYDIRYDIVEDIYNRHKETLYERLEKILRNRQNYISS